MNEAKTDVCPIQDTPAVPYSTSCSLVFNLTHLPTNDLAWSCTILGKMDIESCGDESQSY
jgi:hypothetical protein